MDIFSFILEPTSPLSWLYFFLVVLGFSATPFPLFGTEIIVALAGAVANPFLVGLVAGLASAIGEMSTYVMGRGGEKLLKKKNKEGKNYKTAVKYFERWGFWAVVIFSFTPLPMDLIGLVAGSLKYNAKRFFIAALIGKIPRNIMIAYAGSLGATSLGFFF